MAAFMKFPLKLFNGEMIYEELCKEWSCTRTAISLKIINERYYFYKFSLYVLRHVPRFQLVLSRSPVFFRSQVV